MWCFPSTDILFENQKQKFPKPNPPKSPLANQMVSLWYCRTLNHVLWLCLAHHCSSSTQPSVSPLKPLCRKLSNPCAHAELKPSFSMDENIKLYLYTFWEITEGLSAVGSALKHILQRRESACLHSQLTLTPPLTPLPLTYQCRINYNSIHSYIQCDITKSGVVERLGQIAHPLSFF